MNWKALPVASLIVGSSLTAFAQANASSQAIPQLTLGEMLQKGGPVLWVLGVLSVVALALIIYYFSSLRRDRVINGEFFRNARGLATKHDLEGLSALCLRFDVPLSQIVLAAVEAVRRGDENPMAVREAVESEGERQATTLWIRINILLDIAVVAPMIGLLGTVIGMIKAFGSIAYEMSAAKPVMLAEGVSQALTATGAGLAVGIPAMIFYGYFRGRVQKLVLDLEASASQIVNQLGVRRKERV
jgi:biopolymer transport protein ExbB